MRKKRLLKYGNHPSPLFVHVHTFFWEINLRDFLPFRVKGFFAIDMPKLPDFPKIPEGFLPKFANVKAGFLEFFDIGGKQLDTAKDGIKTAAAAIEVFDGPNKIKIAAEGVGENVKFVAISP